MRDRGGGRGGHALCNRFANLAEGKYEKEEDVRGGGVF